MWRRLAALLLVPTLAWGASPTSVDVSWTAPTTNADVTPLTDLAGYRLYLSTPCPSLQYAIVPSSTAAPGPSETVGVTVNGLMPSTAYTARITSVDFSGNESACSASATGSTLAAAPPAPATNLRLSFGQEPPPSMAATVDASATGISALATLTINLTVGASATALYVGVAVNGPASPTSVVWNTTEGMTQEVVRTTTLNDRVEWYRLVAPTTGAHSVLITYAAAHNILGWAVSVNGSHLTTPTEDSNGAIGNSTAPSVTVATVSSTSLVLSAVVIDSDKSASLTVGANETRIGAILVGASGLSGDASQQAGSNGGVMSRSFTTAEDWGIVAVSVQAPAAAGGAPLAVFDRLYRGMRQ